MLIYIELQGSDSRLLCDMFTMKSPVKLMILITKSDFGGAQRYVYDLATNLPTDKFEVVVALGGAGQLADKLQTDGVRVVYITNLQRNISLLKDLQSVWGLFNLIRTERPDILHLNSAKAGGLGGVLGRLLRVPRIIYTAHGWAFNEPHRGLLAKFLIKFFSQLTVRLSHQTISVSNATKKQLRWPGAESKMTVIYNGRSPVNHLSRDEARDELFKQSKVGWRQCLNDVWSTTLAELHPTKRHDVMIRSVKALVNKGYNIHHCIFGEGEQRDELEKMIETLELTNHVFLCGHLDQADRYLKAFDFLTLTSHSEALAYTVIEACQAGLPIIASRVGGIPEIITHEKDGLLIRRGDVDALTNSVIRLLTDDQLRLKLSTSAKERGDYFTIENMLQQTIAVFQPTSNS